MRIASSFLMSVALGSVLVACGGDDGEGGSPDAAPQIDAAPMIDAPPAGPTALGKRCDPAMMNADCPANAPLCTGFTGTPSYCSPLCVMGGTATGAANNQFTNIMPAPSAALCSAAWSASVGTPMCVGILNNFMPMDNPIKVGDAYTNINMTCAVVCGTGNMCPPGMASNTSLGPCICVPQ